MLCDENLVKKITLLFSIIHTEVLTRKIDLHFFSMSEMSAKIRKLIFQVKFSVLDVIFLHEFERKQEI